MQYRKLVDDVGEDFVYDNLYRTQQNTKRKQTAKNTERSGNQTTAEKIC